MATKGEVKKLTSEKAEELVKSFTDYMDDWLTRTGGFKNYLFAGSYRRKAETVNDVDIILVTAYDFEATAALENFSQSFVIKQILSVGEIKASFILQNGLQVDIYTCRPDELGAMMLYFTGSKQFNISLRAKAAKMGYKLNQEGLYKEEERLPSEDESDILKALGLNFIPPEERSIEFQDWGVAGRLFKKYGLVSSRNKDRAGVA
jgi:DNA polymerase (family 10)